MGAQEMTISSSLLARTSSAFSGADSVAGQESADVLPLFVRVLLLERDVHTPSVDLNCDISGNI